MIVNPARSRISRPCSGRLKIIRTNRAFRGIIDGQPDNRHTAALEAAHHFEQLAYAVLQEDRELANGRIVAATRCREIDCGTFSDTH